MASCALLPFLRPVVPCSCVLRLGLPFWEDFPQTKREVKKLACKLLKRFIYANVMRSARVNLQADNAGVHSCTGQQIGFLSALWGRGGGILNFEISLS